MMGDNYNFSLSLGILDICNENYGNLTEKAISTISNSLILIYFTLSSVLTIINGLYNAFLLDQSAVAYYNYSVRKSLQSFRFT